MRYDDYRVEQYRRYLKWIDDLKADIAAGKGPHVEVIDWETAINFDWCDPSQSKEELLRMRRGMI